MKNKIVFPPVKIALSVTLFAMIVIFGHGCQTKVLGTRPYIPAPAPSPIKSFATPTVVEKNTDIVIDEKVDLPPIKNEPKADFPPIEPVKSKALEYKVKSGDSYWKIARKYGVTSRNLAAYNNSSIDKPLVIGRVLRIPPGGQEISPDKLSPVKPRKKVPRKASAPRRRKPVKQVALKPGQTEYVVQPNDSLWKIERKLRLKSGSLAAVNNLNPKKPLQIGQKLVLPGGAAAPKKAIPGKGAVKTAVPTEKIPEKVPVKSDDSFPSPDEKIGPRKSVVQITEPLIMELEEDTTLSALAKKHGVTPAAIRKLNPNMSADGKLSKGDIVRIPSN